MEALDANEYFLLVKKILLDNNLLNKVYFLATDGAKTVNSD